MNHYALEALDATVKGIASSRQALSNLWKGLRKRLKPQPVGVEGKGKTKHQRKDRLYVALYLGPDPNHVYHGRRDPKELRELPPMHEEPNERA